MPTFIGTDELSKDGRDGAKHESDKGQYKRAKGAIFKEEDYIQIFRKALAKYRYEVYKLLKGKDIKQLTEPLKEALGKLQKKRKMFEINAMILYGFKLDDSDDRKFEHVIEECYLDFQTKSLQPGHKGGAFHLRV